MGGWEGREEGFWEVFEEERLVCVEVVGLAGGRVRGGGGRERASINSRLDRSGKTTILHGVLRRILRRLGEPDRLSVEYHFLQ